MAFIALVDGRRVRCLIRAEALVGLAQQDAASPILTFAEHRQVVEELARELIQNGRLDGSELMIRLSDVIAARDAKLQAAPEAEVPPAELVEAPIQAETPVQVEASVQVEVPVQVEAPVQSVPQAAAVSRGAGTETNGRSMHIPPADCEQIWQSICDRHRSAADRGPYGEFPNLAQRAQNEAQTFMGQLVPTSAHELNVRRVEASRMVSSWKAELTQLKG